MDTLYLNSSWDLCLDLSGNIAQAASPYALAQDAAAAIRTFVGECWYDATQGTPYWTQTLGQAPPLELVRAGLLAAALTVPEVVAARVYFSGFVGRVLTGQVQITNAAGETAGVGF